MKKILTVTLNPAFDLHLSLDAFYVERENYATAARSDAGGKGINISRALLSCGVRSTAYVILGEENGAAFASALERDGMDYVPVCTAGRIRENITLHPRVGRETRVSLDTFSVSPAAFREVHKALLSAVESDTLLAFAGRIPRGVSKGEVLSLLLSLKEKGARLFVDSNSFTLSDLCMLAPAFIKPNEEEIEALYGTPLTNAHDALLAAARLVAEGASERVMISLGGRGAAYADGEHAATVTVPAITPVSTIGAGDSTVAGFLAGTVQGRSLTDTLRLCCAFGTAACLTEGTSPPRAEDVLALYEQTQVTCR